MNNIETRIAVFIRDYQSEQIALDIENGCSDHTLTYEDCQTLSQHIMLIVSKEIEDE
jgi:hypothetical protein